MRWLIGLLAGLLAACGSSPPASVSPGHSSTSSAAPRLSATTPTSAVVAASAAGTCQLPIIQWTADHSQASFLDLASGSLTPDATGGFIQEAVDGGQAYRSVAKPVLAGDSTATYDWTLARWLPARPEEISRDGKHYAYHGLGAIHVVDVATGTDRTFPAPAGPDQVLYYASEGIYFDQLSPYVGPGAPLAWSGPPAPGLWLMNPSSGQVTRVFSDKPVAAVGGFAAWVPTVNASDPQPLWSSSGNLPDEVDRRDLNRGGTVRWFYRPGSLVQVIGFDSDRRAVISVSTPQADGFFSYQVLLAPTPDHIDLVYSGAQVPPVVADQHGIWLSDDRGIWLYSQANGLHQMAKASGQPAGPCLP
jgi:hypothetical protein